MSRTVRNDSPAAGSDSSLARGVGRAFGQTQYEQTTTSIEKLPQKDITLFQKGTRIWLEPVVWLLCAKEQEYSPSPTPSIGCNSTKQSEESLLGKSR